METSQAETLLGIEPKELLHSLRTGLDLANSAGNALAQQMGPERNTARERLARIRWEISAATKSVEEWQSELYALNA